jgi:hypothetical protein
MIGLDISYQLRAGFFLDAFYQYRNKQSALPDRNQKSNYLGAGLRMNLGRFWQEF